jgi:hypothetical protein
MQKPTFCLNKIMAILESKRFVCAVGIRILTIHKKLGEMMASLAHNPKGISH